MEIIGSVTPDAIPEGMRRPGRQASVWASLARRALADHEQGRVTVIRLADLREYKRMRNGTHTYFNQRRFQLNPVIIEQPDGMRVFMELQPLAPDSNQNYGVTISANTAAGGTSVGNRSSDNQARPAGTKRSTT